MNSINSTIKFKSCDSKANSNQNSQFKNMVLSNNSSKQSIISGSFSSNNSDNSNVSATTNNSERFKSRQELIRSKIADLKEVVHDVNCKKDIKKLRLWVIETFNTRGLEHRYKFVATTKYTRGQIYFIYGIYKILKEQNLFDDVFSKEALKSYDEDFKKLLIHIKLGLSVNYIEENSDKSIKYIDEINDNTKHHAGGVFGRTYNLNLLREHINPQPELEMGFAKFSVKKNDKSQYEFQLALNSPIDINDRQQCDNLKTRFRTIDTKNLLEFIKNNQRYISKNNRYNTGWFKVTLTNPSNQQKIALWLNTDKDITKINYDKITMKESKQEFPYQGSFSKYSNAKDNIKYGFLQSKTLPSDTQTFSQKLLNQHRTLLENLPAIILDEEMKKTNMLKEDKPSGLRQIRRGLQLSTVIKLRDNKNQLKFHTNKYNNLSEFYNQQNSNGIHKIEINNKVIYVQVLGNITRELEPNNMNVVDADVLLSCLNIFKNCIHDINTNNFDLLFQNIQTLHKNGIFLRDIKPDNMYLIESNGKLVVALADIGDFLTTKEQKNAIAGTIDYLPRPISIFCEVKIMADILINKTLKPIAKLIEEFNQLDNCDAKLPHLNIPELPLTKIQEINNIGIAIQQLKVSLNIQTENKIAQAMLQIIGVKIDNYKSNLKQYSELQSFENKCVILKKQNIYNDKLDLLDNFALIHSMSQVFYNDKDIVKQFFEDKKIDYEMIGRLDSIDEWTS